MALLAACSSKSNSSTDTDGGATDDGGANAGADAGADAGAGTPFDVWTYEASPGIRAETYTPIPNAEIVWDPPGGGDRVVVQTDAQGHATVYGDFTKGDGTLTIFEASHASLVALQASPALSMITAAFAPNAVGKPDTNFVALLPRRSAAPPPVITKLSGAITNKANAGDYVSVYSPGLGQGADNPGGTYDITVPTARPYTLVGWEWTPPATRPARGLDNTAVKFFTIDRPAQSAASTFDIDVSALTAITTTKGTATVNVMGGDAGPLGNSRSLFVAADADSNAQYGVSPKSVAASDGSSFTESFEYVPAAAGVRVVTKSLLIKQDGAASIALVDGPPQDGMKIDGFLVPPPVTITKSTNADTIAYDGMPTECNNYIFQVLQDGELLLAVGNTRKVASATLPKFPTDVLAALKGVHQARFVCLAGTLTRAKTTDAALPSRIAFSKTWSFTIQ